MMTLTHRVASVVPSRSVSVIVCARRNVPCRVARAGRSAVQRAKEGLMDSNPIGSIVSVLLCCGLLNPALIAEQQAPAPAQAAATPQKYKLTILEGAASSKRVKKGRVSSQAVVKITDENDVPVAGIAVAFTLPQLSAGGAAFAGGGLTSVATTTATGIASSGAFSAATGSSFSVSVAASVPGGVLTGTVSVSTAAAAAAGAGAAGAAGGAAGGAGAGAGVSTGLIVGIVAGVGAVAAVAAKVLSKSTPPTTPPVPPTIPGVGSASSITFGPPK